MKTAQKKFEGAIKLSDPSKMPGFGWGTSAFDCQRGSVLATIPGTVCHGCYAKRGNYRFANVQAAQKARQAQFDANAEQWADKMTATIKANDSIGYFRWFDSGDLQSVEQLKAIVSIAYNLPEIKFWLPTREFGILAKFFRWGNRRPANLTIRLSDDYIDMPRKLPKLLKENGVLQSGVSVDVDKVNCHSYNQHGKCLACRACWDSSERITYKKH